MSLLYGYFLCAIVLDHAHLCCPIGLAWSNQQFRAHMLERPEKFILLPLLCIVIPLGIGAGSLTTRDPALRALAGVYFVWNVWHFAAQNYGICALSGGRVWQRNVAFALTAICMLALPLAWAGLLWVAIAGIGIDLMHWIMDIRLSSFAARRVCLFTLAVLGIGACGFLWKTVSIDPRMCSPLAACTVTWSAPLLISLRLGLGFYHFLIERWMWSSDGRALLLA